MSTRLLQTLTVIALLSTQAGCTKRYLLTAEDHPKANLVAAEFLETKNYLFFSSTEHRFVVCKDTGDALVCSRTCGGAREIQCPMGELSSLSAKTNVR